MNRIYQFAARNVVNIVSLAVIVVLFVNVWRALSGQVYTIEGNIHDFFLPWNAALAIEQGLKIHHDFHSPFGPVYFYLSAAAVSIINQFPDILNLADIHYLSSGIFSIAIVMIFAVARFFRPGGDGLPLWLLAILLLLCFQARDVDLNDDPFSNWYGIYNSQLWALILLQVAIVMHWSELARTRMAIVKLALMQAVCAMLAAHYKMSFFLASAVICILPILYLPSTRSIGFYILSGVAACAAIITLGAVSGFSYAGYFTDLKLAAEAKTSGGSASLDRVLRVCVVFTLIVQFLRTYDRSIPKRGVLIVGWIRLYFSPKNWDAAKMRDLGFDATLGLALSFAVVGDFNRAIVPLFIAASFYVFSGYRNGELRKKERWSMVHLTIIYFLAAFIWGSIQATTYVAQNSELSEHEVSNPRHFQVAFLDGESIAFRFRRWSPFDNFVEDAFYDTSTEWKQNLIDYALEVYDPYRETVKNLNFNFEFLMMAVGRTPNYTRGIYETLDWFERTGVISQSNLKISNVGFANPWPLLTGNEFPDKSLHWNHLGTTLPHNNLTPYLNSIASSDIVVMQLLSTDGHMQWKFNCAFTLWNQGNGMPFTPVDVVGFNLILARTDGGFEFPDNAFFTPRLHLTAGDGKGSPACNI